MLYRGMGWRIVSLGRITRLVGMGKVGDEEGKGRETETEMEAERRRPVGSEW